MKKRHILIYIWIGILSLIMLAMAVISFLWGENRYEITESTIAVFAIIAGLLVLDSVESLGIGNLLTLKMKVKEKEKEADRLSEENDKLRAQLLTVMQTSIRSQNHNQIIFTEQASTASDKHTSPD